MEWLWNNKLEQKCDKWIYFFKSSFVGVNRLLVMVYSNKDNDSKSFKTQR